ncbi:MAG: hypothetical protein QM817_34970 [Archangium sp.]
MRLLLISTVALLASCTAPPMMQPAGPPPCDSNRNGLVTLIPGPGQDGFDETLAAAARLHDRQFHAFNAFATGLNAEFIVTDPLNRDAIAQFLATSDGFDFEAATGRSPSTLGTWTKSAGLYAGVGIAADAFRYGVLRDSGASCAEVEIARAQLLRGLESLDTAARIPGVPGVMARSLLRTDLPAAMPLDTTPLFDGSGMPLPAVKNNGTWRADNSGGAYASLIWEDSLSKDMIVGWAMGLGVSFEVLAGDATFPAELKARLQEDATRVGRALMKVGTEGYDLEIPDADGRVTYNGLLNENAIDRFYLAGADNGVHSIMSLGIVGALASVSDDAELDAYLSDTLVAQRRLDRSADVNAHLVDMGTLSNYSGYNMALTGAFLAQRYVPGETAGRLIRRAIRDELYARPEQPMRQPKEAKQTFFDVIYAHATQPDGDALATAREQALTQGVQTLREFPAAPFWDAPRMNCDDDEIRAGVCTLDDGTVVNVLGEVGRNDSLVADQPVPMRVRPRSNYYWRSNPYSPNDSSPGTGTVLNSGVDFRVAYWMGRWLRQ